jgi:hypothetical protein
VGGGGLQPSPGNRVERAAKIIVFNEKLFIFCFLQILNCWVEYKDTQYMIVIFVKFIISVGPAVVITRPGPQKSRVRHWQEALVTRVS